jgi:hypothetical protein
MNLPAKANHPDPARTEAIDDEADYRRTDHPEHRNKTQSGDYFRPAPAELLFQRLDEDARDIGPDRSQRHA